MVVTGRRFGKTTLAITTLLIDALSQPDKYFWYVAPSYRQAKMISWRMFKGLCKDLPEALKPRINESELSLLFPNGSQIELRGADNEDSLRGVGLDGMVIDEFATIHDNWSVWNEVLRPILADKEGWAMFIGTPKGKDALYELWLRGERGEDGWASFHFRTVDNLAVDLTVEVERARSEMPERYFRQEYEGSFEDFVGLIYPEFSPKLHVVEPRYLPEVYPRIGAIDPAVSGTTAALKAAIDEKDTIIVYEEYYELNKRASEVAGAIRDDKTSWLIDPASQAKNQRTDGHLYSLYDEYGDNGIRPRTAENSVEAGINRVGEYFKRGKIKIFSSCTNLLWEIERYHWAEMREGIKGEPKPVPYKKDDHLCDCLRYIVMSRAQGADLSNLPQNPNSAWGRFLRERQEMASTNFKYGR